MEPAQRASRSHSVSMMARLTQTSIWDNRSIVYQNDLPTALSELLFPQTIDNLPVLNWKWANPYSFYYNLRPIKPNAMTADAMALMEREKVIGVVIRHGDPNYVDPFTKQNKVAIVVRVFSLVNRFVCETVHCHLPQYPTPTDCPFEFIVQDTFTREVRDKFVGFTFIIGS